MSVTDIDNIDIKGRGREFGCDPIMVTFEINLKQSILGWVGEICRIPASLSYLKTVLCK